MPRLLSLYPIIDFMLKLQIAVKAFLIPFRSEGRWLEFKAVEVPTLLTQCRQLSEKVLAERSGVLSLAEGSKPAAARSDFALRTA